MRLLILNILLVFCASCGIQPDEQEVEAKPLSSFNLNSDYLHFRAKLEEGDTLRVFANLSMCNSWHLEENFFIKRNGKVFIKSVNEGCFIDDADTLLPEVEYSTCSSDTLSFEYLFEKLGDERKDRNGSSLSRLSLSFRADTIRFYSFNLTDAIRIVNHYTEIKRCLYPEAELYKPVVIPQDY